MLWGIILDVLTLAVLVIFIFISAKKGFARTILEFAAIIVAILLAVALGGKAADWVYDSFIKDSLVSGITTTVDNALNDTVENFTESLPEILVKGAKAFGIYDKISECRLESVEGTVSALETNIMRPIATSILKVIASIILFVVLLFLLNLLVKAIDKVFKLPVVGDLNRALGGIVGFLKGLAVLFVAFSLIAAISVAVKGDFLIFSEENINNSHIFKLIYNNNPLMGFMTGFTKK